MSVFLKHNSNASVRLSWNHSSTHLPLQSALMSLARCSGLSTHVLLFPVALLGLPCNRKCNCYSLFLRTAGLEFGLDIFPNRFFAVPLLQWHVKPPLRALWSKCLQTTAGARRRPRATAVLQPAQPSSRCLSFCLRISLDKYSDFLPINFSIGCHFTNALHVFSPPADVAPRLFSEGG